MPGCFESEEKGMWSARDFLVIRRNKVGVLFTVHALITQVSDSVKLQSVACTNQEDNYYIK